MHRWCFQRPCSEQPSSDLVMAIHQTFLEGFGLEEGWSPEGIRRRLNGSTIFGLAQGDEGAIVGYAFYTIPDEPLGGAYLLWEDAVCLQKVAQHQGLSFRAVEDALALFPNQAFGWVGGRTQNPIVIKRYARFGTLFPFDAPYAEGEGNVLMDYLIGQVAEVGEVQKLDRITGICHNVYREGRLGDYPTDVEGTMQFEEQLLRWGFDRDAGDAVIVVARLSNAVQRPR